MTRRTERIEDQFRIEISDLLRRELRDPRVGLASVSDVEVTSDLRHARVKMSVLGDEAARLGAIEALQHARGFIRGQLARRLRHLRAMPELDFELDRGAEYSQRIQDLLAELPPPTSAADDPDDDPRGS